MGKKLADYDIRFEALFTVPEATTLFRSYLARSLNDDGFNFVLEVRELKANTTLSNEEKLAKILEIVDTYIVEGSQKEVNIDAATKKPVIKIVDETLQKTDLVVPVTVFDDIAAVITRELKEDAFCRFIRSECLEDYLKRCKDDSFLFSIAKKKEEARDPVRVEAEDFYNLNITDAHISKMFAFAEDCGEWLPVRRTKRNERERSNYSYVRAIKNADGQTIYSGKATGSLPFSAEHGLHALMHFDRRKEWDHIQNRWDVIDFVPSDNERMYSQHTSVYEIVPPFPLKKRITQVAGSLLYDNVRQCYFWIGKTLQPFKHESMQESLKSGSVAMDLWVFIQFYKVSETSCRYVYIGIADMHMQINSLFMFRKMLKTHFKSMHDSWVGICESIKDTWEKQRPEHDAKLYATLDDFRSKFPEGKTWTDFGYIGRKKSFTML
jgi:hypothetical protein